MAAVRFTPWPVHGYSSRILHQQLAEQQESAQFTDFVSSSNGQELHCHRNVLAASCQYFYAMLSSSMKEALEGKATVDFISFRVLNSIVQFLYGKSIDIDSADIENAIEAAELFQIKDLSLQLESYMCLHLKADNCIYFLKMAEKFNLKRAGARAKDLLLSDIEHISKSHCFKQLTYAELIDCVQSDDPVISHQDKILNACLDWVLADLEERKPLLLGILKRIRVDLCSVSAIRGAYNTNRELFCGMDVKGYLFEVVLPKIERLELFQQKPHPYMEQISSNETWNIMVFGSMYTGRGIFHNECWAIGEKCFGNGSGRLQDWEKVTTIPNKAIGKQVSCVCVEGRFAALCGGPSKTINCRFDILTKVWSDLPRTPEILNDTIALHMNSNIYVLDGGSNDQMTNTMYILDLKSLTWRKGPARIATQCPPICTVHKQSIWVWGNDTRGHKMTPVPLQMLNTGSSKWELRSCVPPYRTRGTASIVGCGEYLYLIGGDKCCRYNISNDQWTKLSNIPSNISSRWSESAFVLHNKIYLCGGNIFMPVISVSEYNIATGSWKTCEVKLPADLRDVSVALLSAWPSA